MKSALTASALFGVILAGSSACANHPPANPAWLDQLVAGFKAEAVANPPRRILRYRYRGQNVYYVPPSCCDQPSSLYDEGGELLCAPDGGMTGRGDGRCADFHRLKSDESVLWSDARSR